MDLGETISTKEAARRLGVTPGTIRNWVKNHRLRGYRIGYNFRISKDDVDLQLERAREEQESW